MPLTFAVEEDHDGDGLVAVVEEGVSQIRVLIAEEHAQLTVRHRLRDVRDEGRIPVDVPAPVLGEHQHVRHLGDGAEELPLVLGQDRFRVVVLGAGPGVAHLGHVVLPGQAFGEALRVQGDSQLGHVVLSSVGVAVAAIYTPNAEARTGARVGRAARPAAVW